MPDIFESSNRPKRRSPLHLIDRYQVHARTEHMVSLQRLLGPAGDAVARAEALDANIRTALRDS